MYISILYSIIYIVYYDWMYNIMYYIYIVEVVPLYTHTINWEYLVAASHKQRKLRHIIFLRPQIAEVTHSFAADAAVPYGVCQWGAVKGRQNEATGISTMAPE